MRAEYRQGKQHTNADEYGNQRVNSQGPNVDRTVSSMNVRKESLGEVANDDLLKGTRFGGSTRPQTAIKNYRQSNKSSFRDGNSLERSMSAKRLSYNVLKEMQKKLVMSQKKKEMGIFTGDMDPEDLESQEISKPNSGLMSQLASNSTIAVIDSKRTFGIPRKSHQVYVKPELQRNNLLVSNVEPKRQSLTSFISTQQAQMKLPYADRVKLYQDKINRNILKSQETANSKDNKKRDDSPYQVIGDTNRFTANEIGPKSTQELLRFKSQSSLYDCDDTLPENTYRVTTGQLLRAKTAEKTISKHVRSNKINLNANYQNDHILSSRFVPPGSATSSHTMDQTGATTTYNPDSGARRHTGRPSTSTLGISHSFFDRNYNIDKNTDHKKFFRPETLETKVYNKIEVTGETKYRAYKNHLIDET